MPQLALTGSTGLIGAALRQHLTSVGWSVLQLVRRPAQSPSEIRWDPTGQSEVPASDLEHLAASDAVVHLAGENVAGGLWTRDRMQRIRDSRVQGTTSLVDLLSHASRKPPLFLAASAVGFYGNRGDETLTESSPPGTGFLADVCQEWEAASARASTHGMRTVIARFGVVLDAHGGALAKMLPAFRLGAGAVLGSGTQWIPWISLDDVIGALTWLLGNPAATGIYNVVSPAPVTQRQFADSLAAALHRPRLFGAPATLLRLAAGKMADEALLASERVLPARLEREGFTFRDRELASTLRRLLP